jgi:hypothetical protein
VSANKNTPKTESARVTRLVPVLIGVNVVLGLAFVITLAAALFGSGSHDDTAIPSVPANRPPEPLIAQADTLIADLHCPCAGCGHRKFSSCDTRCGERRVVRDFVLQHLRSGADALTALAHVEDRFGDLTSIAAAQAAWDSRHPQIEDATPVPPAETEELPPDWEPLEEQPDRS